MPARPIYSSASAIFPQEIVIPENPPMTYFPSVLPIIPTKPYAPVFNPRDIYTPKINKNDNNSCEKKDVYSKNTDHLNICDDISYETDISTDLVNPEIWGPGFWFMLQNGAARYPILAAPFVQENMKNFILGIPFMLPCRSCYPHCTAYIEEHRSELDSIVEGREKLFHFFWEFHNAVNERLGKPTITLDEAKDKYFKGRNVKVMNVN